MSVAQLTVTVTTEATVSTIMSLGIGTAAVEPSLLSEITGVFAALPRRGAREKQFTPR